MFASSLTWVNHILQAFAFMQVLALAQQASPVARTVAYMSTRPVFTISMFQIAAI